MKLRDNFEKLSMPFKWLDDIQLAIPAGQHVKRGAFRARRLGIPRGAQAR